MKSLKFIMITLGGAALTLSAAAQTPGDLLRMSQYNYSFGTARSAAMGGAFTSLGADLSSMSINPAGLGMYRGSEIGFSPSVTSSSMQNTYLGNIAKDSKTKFSVGNLSAAFNLHQGAGALTSFTLGVGYNKMADFNTSSWAYGYNNLNSIAEIFAEDLHGVRLSQLGHPDNDPYLPFRNQGVDRWGSILAFQTGVLNPVSNDPNNDAYTAFDPDPNGNSPASGATLSKKMTANPMLRNLSQGSIGEYTISGGFNFQNIIYFGLTIGIQDVYYKNQNVYSETYNNNQDFPLNQLNYIRSLKMNGTGVNAKFGITVRPIDNLRIGLAVHTPTYINFNEEYVEYMSTNTKNYGQGDLLDSPYSLNEYNITTPTRLLAGLSYTLPGIGLISADYERVWYNGMRISQTDDWQFENGIKQDVQNLYKPANNFRAGIEVIPTKNLYVRAGYAYYDNNQRNDDGFINQENIQSYQNYSVGLGYHFNHLYVDLAYIYTDYKYADSRIFFYEDKNENFTISSGDISTKMNRSTVTLSMGVRF